MYIVSQTTPKVKSNVAPLQSNNRAEILALADHALQQWQRARGAWLASGDPDAWRLMQAAEADRAALLEQAGAGHD